MPIPLIVVGAVILLLLLLLATRIRVTILCNEQVSVTLRILFVRIRLYPRRKRVKPKRYSAKEEKRRPTKKKASPAPADTPKEKLTLMEKLTLVRGLSAALIRKTRKKLHLHAARLHIRVATGDAAGTAVLYGAVSGTLACLLAGLERVTKLKATEPEVAVIADYLSERSSADVKLIFSIRIWSAFTLLVTALLANLRQKQQIRIARKQKQKAAQKAARA